MTKVAGFLEIERHHRKYEPVESRIRHWQRLDARFGFGAYGSSLWQKNFTTPLRECFAPSDAERVFS
jgi:hypothetical protein